jgi:hypothetical protein
MISLLHQQIDELRGVLLKLPATGSKGFEGLLAITLTSITGAPFRLARSGSQFGVDGTTAYEEDAVCFEGKRYDDHIPRTEVLTKIAELAIGDVGGTDLWVLGATTQVSAQLADDVRELGAKLGIATLILDWNDAALPPLAVALAMAETSATFLESNIGDHALAAKAATALKIIAQDEKFAAHAERLRALLHEPTMGAGLARQANARWLINVFSSKREAKRFLRQPLCPGDKTIGGATTRSSLISRITPLLTGKPDGRIAAILGDEGNGKSWLAAQSWLALTDRPLMVVFAADDFDENFTADDLTAKLIDKLIIQTGGNRSDVTHNRWRRKMDRWRKSGTPDAPRFIVLIDGLNQRPQIDWARFIEAMGSELDRVGGRLMITARTAYYAARVRQRLYSPAVEVDVPEWTDAERDAILATHGIKGIDLRASVGQSLRNPRLLGIAVELLDSEQLNGLEELSVSRLLFEHLRVNERDAPSPRPAREFARRLQDHAREILSRVTAQQRDDLTVFDGELEAVSDGRFFIAVEDDPTRYSLGDSGLTLALGFAVLDELRAARRNRRDLADALKAMIEPIGALDRTAQVIFAAITIACLDEECATDIGAAIVGGFAELQNPDTHEFPAFAALATRRPEAFMQAAQRLCLASARQPNFDWIEEALHEEKKNDRAWLVMTPLVKSCLIRYSLVPEARVINPAPQVEEERGKRQNEINSKMSALSAPEQKLFGMLIRDDDGDLATLAQFALTLIAGKPVAPFATALASWSFANALNRAIGAPYKELMSLVRLNRADWPQAREAILEACGIFDSVNASRTGKWALISLLHATGDPDDAARAQSLTDELTAGRRRFGGWRLVEEYCATDPCDPGSRKPDNVAATAASYAAIDVSKIRLHISSTDVDHFFDMARPGIARFEPQVAVSKHREFIASALERSGFALRQGLLEMRKHNSLLTRDDAERLVAQFVKGTAYDTDETLGETDQWIVSQYQLLVAFPLLNANEQIEALLAGRADEKVLLELINLAKPLDEGTLEALLDRAIRNRDDRGQYVLLTFARRASTPIPANVLRQVATLVRSESEAVRTAALGLIASNADEASIEATVKSGWNAAKLAENDTYEAWYGSCVMIEAAARGVISGHEALEGIAPELYGRAARRLGADVARDVARLIDASIKSAAGLALDIAVPDIEVASLDEVEPARYRASKRPSASTDPVDALRRLLETNEAFEERQKRAAAAFGAFKAQLTRAKASIILDRLGIQDFDAIAEADKPLAESWYDLFVGLPKARRPSIHNLGLLLAHALAHWDPNKAVSLFAMLASGEPFMRITYGRAGITLDAITLWSASDYPPIDSLRFGRLDKAANDHEIAIEVLAALWNGKQGLLQAYIDSRLRLGEPATIARALMVAGFSTHNEFNDRVLDRYKDTPGLIGQARAAAMDAYERNIWSEHWFRRVREAQEVEDFWRHEVLLEKVVDGRIDSWMSNDPDGKEPYRMFWPSARSLLEHRLKKWQSQREKKLFGDDAPEQVFLG